METRCAGVDPPSATVCSPLDGLRSRAASRRPVRCCAVGYVAERTSLAAILGSVAIDWKGMIPSARPARETSLFGKSTFGGADRDQKSPVRRCFKSRPSFGEVRRFASGCRSFLRAVNRPLVRIPADRHTTTGTCDLGKKDIVRIAEIYKRFFRPRPIFRPSQICHRGSSASQGPFAGAGTRKFIVSRTAARQRAAHTIVALRLDVPSRSQRVSISASPNGAPWSVQIACASSRRVTDCVERIVACPQPPDRSRAAARDTFIALSCFRRIVHGRRPRRERQDQII